MSMVHTRQVIRRPVILAGVVLSGLLAVPTASATSGLNFGTPFSLLPSPPLYVGSVLSTSLSSDDTAWIADADLPDPDRNGSIRVMARTDQAQTLGPIKVSASRGTAILPPVISAHGENAVVAWLSYQGALPTEEEVRAMLCTETGCARPQTVFSWFRKNDPVDPLEEQPGPSVTWVGSRALLLFRGSSSKGQRLQWSITTGSRFGRVHTLGEDGLEPEIAALPGGQAVAVWQSYASAPGQTFPSIELRTARWSGGEFARPSTLPSAAGQGVQSFDQQLAVDGPKVIVAWTQSTPTADGEERTGNLWLTNADAGSAFGPPTEIYEGQVGALSLAAGAGRVALAFSTYGPFGQDPASDTNVSNWATVTGLDGNLQAPTPLISGSKDADLPSVAIDGHGYATVAELSGSLEGSSVQALVAPPGGDFGPPSTIGYGQYASPLVATHSGATLITWIPGPTATNPPSLGTRFAAAPYQALVAVSP
jgi:VCBS repeat-containing protein